MSEIRTSEIQTKFYSVFQTACSVSDIYCSAFICEKIPLFPQKLLTEEQIVICNLYVNLEIVVEI